MSDAVEIQKITLCEDNIEEVALWLNASSYTVTHSRLYDKDENIVLDDFVPTILSFITATGAVNLDIGETLVRGTDPVMGDFIGQIPPPVKETPVEEGPVWPEEPTEPVEEIPEEPAQPVEPEAPVEEEENHA